MIGRLVLCLCVGCVAAEPSVRAAGRAHAPQTIASPSVGAPLDPDRMRGLLYRIDGETRLAYLHPSEAIEHAQAAERMANDLAARASRVPALWPEAGRLQGSVRAMAEAARRHQPEDVRAAARSIAVQVRAFDESLPAPPPRP